MVFLDDQLFVDGRLTDGSSGDYFPLNKNNHHVITADEPLPSTATLGGRSTDQRQDLQEHAHRPVNTTSGDLRKSVSQCNQTIAALIDKKLLKFTKSKRGFFKKQTTTFSQEREEVLETLQRLSEQSRQVVQNEENMKRQLGIKQRNQVILERIITSFGKELRDTNCQIFELNNQLESTNIKCQELEESNSRWAEKFAQKDKECQKIRKEEKILAQLVTDKDHVLDDVTKELSNAKGQVKSLEATNFDLETEKTVLFNTLTKERENHQKAAEAKKRLFVEKKCLESGVKILEARMKQQKQFYEDQMNKMKESYEMEIIKMKETTDAEMVKRDELFQDLFNQLTEEQNHHKSVKRETDVIKTSMEEKEKENKTIKNDIKLLKESLNLFTVEKEKLIESHQEQVNHLQNEMKILREKLTDEKRCRTIVEDLHQRLMVTKKDEEDRFTVCQVELFLKSCADNALLGATMQIQKKHHEEAAEANRRCSRLQQNNEQLQKKFRAANERYSIFYRDFEKLRLKLVKAEKKIASLDAVRDCRSIPAVNQIHSMPRIKELESELVKKMQEQEDMRVLIRWLKKDLSKAEKDLAQVISEKQELMVSTEKGRTHHKRVVKDLETTIVQQKLIGKNVYEKRDDKNRRLAKKMTDLHQQLKISYNDLQRSKSEADEEVERLKDQVREMEDELDEMDEELDYCEQDIEELEDDLDDAEYEIELKEKEIRKLKMQAEELLKTKKNLEKKLRSFQSRA